MVRFARIGCCPPPGGTSVTAFFEYCFLEHVAKHGRLADFFLKEFYVSDKRLHLVVNALFAKPENNLVARHHNQSEVLREGIHVGSQER